MSERAASPWWGTGSPGAAQAWRDCPTCGCAQFLAMHPVTQALSWSCGSCGHTSKGHVAELPVGRPSVATEVVAGERHFSRLHRIDYALRQRRRGTKG